MAGSSGLHDSRLSLVRVHIPLPAVRPRQRSWGTSLPQSVILWFLCYSALALLPLLFSWDGDTVLWRNGLFRPPSRSPVTCLHELVSYEAMAVADS